MKPVILNKYYIDNNLLLLEEILYELNIRSISCNILFRSGEQKDVERILEFGTDRGGYPGKKKWRYASETGRHVLHEDVIYATTRDEIIMGENEISMSTSFKKFSIIDAPVVMIYNADSLDKIYEKQYVFKEPSEKKQALLALFFIEKIPPIKGWFSEEEGLFYRSLAAEIKNGKIVEIGSWMGRSTSFIGNVCRANHTDIYCVDTWNGSTDEYCLEYKKYLSTHDVEKTFRQNIEHMGMEPKIFKQSSVQAANEFDDDSLDLVFIDGSHDLRAVNNDLNAWHKKIKAGGRIAGHDYCDKFPGVMKAVNDFSRKYVRDINKGTGTIWYLNL